MGKRAEGGMVFEVGEFEKSHIKSQSCGALINNVNSVEGIK